MERCYEDGRSGEKIGGLYVVKSGILKSKCDWPGTLCIQEKNTRYSVTTEKSL